MKLDEYVSPEELRRLLRSLVVFLCALGLFLFFGFTVVPGIRNANRPQVLPGVEPVVRETGWLDPVEFAPERARVIPPLDPKDILDPTPELLAKGKDLYGQICAQCHGADGRGNGPSAKALDPPPRNLAAIDGWKVGPARPSIYRVLSEGIAGSSMAAYDTLRPTDRMALVHHVRSFQQPAPPPEDAAAIEELAKRLAQAPTQIPNRIPMSLAIEKLAAEDPEVPALALPAADAADATDPGAVALREAVSEPARAARTLRGSRAWRDSVEALARAVAIGLPSNGFSTRTMSFDATEWRALHRELITRLAEGP